MRHTPGVIVFAVLLAQGCASPSTPAPTAPPPQATNPAPAGVIASAVVEPVQSSHLSFVIAGLVDEIAVQAGDAVQAGQTLITINVPELEYGVLQAEADVRAAEFEYEYWVPARFDRPPERRQLAEQELHQVQRSLETALAEALQATLTAPYDASVVSIETASGELVQPAQVVITVADLTTMLVKTTDLSERDLADVRIGQPAKILIEAMRVEYSGTVVAISPLAGSVGGDVVYEVTVAFDEQPPGLLWGMSAEVEIDTHD